MGLCTCQTPMWYRQTLCYERQQRHSYRVIEVDSDSASDDSLNTSPFDQQSSTSGTRASTFSTAASTSGIASTSGRGADSKIATQSSAKSTSVTQENDETDHLLSPSGTAVDPQKVEILSGMFPTIPNNIVRNAVMTCQTLNTAVNVLLQYDVINTIQTPSHANSTQSKPKKPDKPETLPEVLRRLRANVQPRGTREKVKVEQDDMVMDMYSFYKSPDFDPTVAIFISLKGQPAIDTGGVLRQVFSDVFHAIAHNEGIKNVFSGSEYKVPVFSNELVVNGFFEVLGKMIAHSLVQSGPGFPYLSPTIYYYLATGDLQMALQKASWADVDNTDLAQYITRAENKLDVLQSLMLHNILVRKKALLDQFRNGLSILGFLQEMEEDPQLFEECFVFQGQIDNSSVASILYCPSSEDKDAKKVFEMLLMFIRNCKADALDDFLSFVTGISSSAKCILPRRIQVTCGATNSIFASTCLLELKLPNHFKSYSEFEGSYDFSY